MAPYNMAEIYQNFGENGCFHLQGKFEDRREDNKVKVPRNRPEGPEEGVEV
jgi:hypothetical protein